MESYITSLPPDLQEKLKSLKEEGKYPEGRDPENMSFSDWYWLSVRTSRIERKLSCMREDYLDAMLQDFQEVFRRLRNNEELLPDPSASWGLAGDD